VDLPDRQPLPVADQTIYARRFNCPTGLSAGTRVGLVIESWTGTLSAELDGVDICERQPPMESPLCIDLTDRLRGHHCIEIRLDGDGETGAVLNGICYLQID
jgi:hypothetical protein